MTTEEKAKAYDEAVNKIRPLYEQAIKDGNPIWSIYEYLIPQLIESEDERIRKKLIETIGYFRSRGIDQQLCEKFLSYLEKQKEEEGYDAIPVESTLEYKLGFKAGKDFEKQKKQKPITCINFDNEFENQVSHLLASVLNGEHKYNEGFVKYAAQALLEYAKKEQKPAEVDEYEIIKKHITEDVLSSEVNKRLKECGWYVTDENPAGATINGKPIPTENQSVDIPLAEWSEEDEEMLNSCISSIEESKENRYAYKETDGDTSYDREVDWLKSLRPIPRWKPSEKHLSVLLAVFNDPDNIGSQTCQLALTDLYEQLKKL